MGDTIARNQPLSILCFVAMSCVIGARTTGCLVTDTSCVGDDTCTTASNCSLKAITCSSNNNRLLRSTLADSTADAKHASRVLIFDSIASIRVINTSSVGDDGCVPGNAWCPANMSSNGDPRGFALDSRGRSVLGSVRTGHNFISSLHCSGASAYWHPEAHCTAPSNTTTTHSHTTTREGQSPPATHDRTSFHRPQKCLSHVLSTRFNRMDSRYTASDRNGTGSFVSDDFSSRRARTRACASPVSLYRTHTSCNRCFISYTASPGPSDVTEGT